MLQRKHTALGIIALVGLSAGVGAHVRLIYSGNGQELSWPSAANLPVVIQSVGSADVPGDSDAHALRNAIDVWNQVDGSFANLVENTDAAQQARTDWAADDIHLLAFDETNSSGYFPNGSGIVAITPLEFFTSGGIVDADVLFNGKDFLFSTEPTSGRFDIQDVATHELGHLLGLDHSGVAGASMYPYVDPSIILHRSLSMDDIGGLRDIYPSQSFGVITGNLKRASDGTALPGGYVIAVDAGGRTTGSGLADSAGVFRIEGLPGGIYDVWADPLDYPVSSGNLTSGHTIETDFESKFLGQVVLGNGQTSSMGNQSLDADVSISLGRIADDYPLRVIAGRTVARTVRGTGLAIGSTLTCPDPAVTITPTTWSNNSVQFNVTVPAGAPLGHIDLLVTNAAGDQDLLPGALEVTPSDPTVTNVTPSMGPGTGGYGVTLTGTNFNSGCRVVIGNQVYTDGQAGFTVVDQTTIQLTLASTVAGPHDVVVIDGSGVEGRLTQGFDSQANPSIQSIFPSIGAASGGTVVTLSGQNFVDGATVTINSIPQLDVTVMDSGTLTFETVLAAPGGPHLVTLENPGGEQAQSAYSFVATPDPELNSVFPNSGPEGGGTEVTILGDGFNSATQVYFGSNPYTGQGGSLAATITVVDENRITVVTPAGGSPYSSVLVQDSMTNQTAVMDSGFTFESNSSTSEEFSFGGCHAAPQMGPSMGKVSWRQVMEGSLWMVLLYGLLIVRGRFLRMA